MPPFAMSLTKQVQWRGQPEQFSNVFHYDFGVFPDSEASMNTLLDNLWAKEQARLGTNVSVVEGRIWGPTNQGPVANITRVIRPMSGNGSIAGADIPFELAVVLSWYIGRSPTTQRKRFLRKYYHPCRLIATGGGNDFQLGNGALTPAEKDPWVAFGNDLKNLQLGVDNFPICAPNGDHLPANTQVKVLDHLHTRQFRQ